MDEKTRIFWLGVGLMTACFAYFFVVTFISLPTSGAKYADMIVPFLLGSGLGAIAGFYWGSSEGSSQKNTLLGPKPPEVAEKPKEGGEVK